MTPRTPPMSPPIIAAISSLDMVNDMLLLALYAGEVANPKLGNGNTFGCGSSRTTQERIATSETR